MHSCKGRSKRFSAAHFKAHSKRNDIADMLLHNLDQWTKKFELEKLSQKKPSAPAIYARNTGKESQSGKPWHIWTLVTIREAIIDKTQDQTFSLHAVNYIMNGGVRHSSISPWGIFKMLRQLFLTMLVNTLSSGQGMAHGQIKNIFFGYFRCFDKEKRRRGGTIFL